MYSTIKRFRHAGSGQIAVATAVLSMPLLAVAAVMVEYSNLSDNQSRLQNAVDAAALYTGKYALEYDRLPTQHDVTGFVIKNFDGDIGTVQITGTSDQDSDYRVVATSRAPQYFFGKLLPDAYNQTAEALVPKASLPNMTVALVLDTTGSMGGSKIVSLRLRASEFIDDMAEAAKTTDELKVGIVPYDRHVNIGSWNRHEYWVDVDGDLVDWEGCVGSRSAPYTFKDTAPNVRFTGVAPPFSCPQAVTPLTDDWDALKADINSLQIGGWTYAAVGVMWGLRVLSPEAPFQQAASMDSPLRVMIVMADGANTKSNSLSDDEPLNDTSDRAAADRNTREACDEAKFQGVTIYSIAFGTSISTSAANLLRDCASEDTNFFAATDSDGLKDAFDQIARELTRLRLTG